MSRRLFRPTPRYEDPHRRDAPGMDEPLTSWEPSEREDAGEDPERPDRRGGRRRATVSAAALARLGGRGGALTAMGRGREARGRAPEAPGLACRCVAAIACACFSTTAVVDQTGIPRVRCWPVSRGIRGRGAGDGEGLTSAESAQQTGWAGSGSRRDDQGGFSDCRSDGSRCGEQAVR
jgi:hypothetical protein